MKNKIILVLFFYLSNFSFSQNPTQLDCPKTITVNTVSDLNTIHQSYSADVTTAIVLGYHEKDDGGGGIFVYDSSLDNPNIDGEGDGGLLFDGWKRSIVDSSINVKWFGAKGDGANPNPNNLDIVSNNTALIANNTLAFQKSIRELHRRWVLPEGISTHLHTSGIFIPSGEYLLGEQALYLEEFTPAFTGISYFSDGNAILSFTNTGDTYGFYNKNSGLYFTFKNITFIGFNKSTNVFYSNSQGIAQDYYFERCSFFGKFNRVFTLRGGSNGDTNSEWGFNKCAFTCDATILDIKDSDQFLNYWFDQCKFNIKGNGKVLVADEGGHFKFINCDWSGFKPNEETYLFELKESLYNEGVNDFRVINGRFELHNEFARVLKSNWKKGHIEFSADFGSQNWKPNVLAAKHFDFNIKPDNHLNVYFKNSTMAGYHRYNYWPGSYTGLHSAIYENCSFTYRNSLDGFIKLEGSGGRNGGSFIEIKNALFNRISNDKQQISNVNYLPLNSNKGLKKKYFKIGDLANGGNPIGSQEFVLNFPEEAESVITKVTWFLPQGALSSTANVNYALTDLTGQVIISQVSGILYQGLDHEHKVNIHVKDLQDGKLVLKDLNSINGGGTTQSTNKFMCIIEYY